MGTKRFMILTHGSSATLGVVGLTLLAWGNAVASSSLRVLGGVIVGVTLLVVIVALYVVGRGYMRLIGGLRVGSRLLRSAAANAEGAATQRATAASEQSAAIAETSATVEELAAAASAIADNSRAVSEATTQTEETMDLMRTTVDSIAQRAQALSEGSQQIDEILSLIDELSGQTNLLSLNAAIEAARAGEAGRGFGVVASEVRKLAERSLHSSDAIREIVRTIQQEATATVLATEHGTRQVHEVSALMTSTAEMVSSSILATQQQHDAAEKVAHAITQIRLSAEQILADRERHLSAARELSERADELVTILAALGAGPDHTSGAAGNFVRRNVRESGTPLLLQGAAAAMLGLQSGTEWLAAGIALGALGSAFFVYIRYYRVHRLLGALASIRAGLDNLGAVVTEIGGGAAEATAAVAEQSAAVAETAATIEELAVSAAAIAESSTGVASAAQQTAETMEELHETVESIATRSHELEERSQQIARILSLIDELAGQTSLLSLNAAIEAARSGASGKGFAVVADEVRNLAERSRESSDAIRGVIRTILDETDATSRAAEEGTLEAHRVTQLMTETAGMLEQSILATQQQQSAAEQVAAAVAQIRTSSEQLVDDSSAQGVDAVGEAIGALEAALDGMVGNGWQRRSEGRAATPTLAPLPHTSS